MKRVVKAPAIRRAEILKVATTLFQTQGYAATSINEITLTAGIAKGTFYYYFQSKEHILDELTQELVTKMAERSQLIADQLNMGAIEKMCAIIGVQNQVQEGEQHLVDSMHCPQNFELHERINIKTVQVFAPILAAVVEQGNQEGVFQVDDPLSTVEFILAGSQFILGDGVFNWTPQEEAAKTQAMLVLIERTFGAVPGTFAPKLGEVLDKKRK